MEDSSITHRLYDLGIYPGQTLKMLRKAPLGDPMIVEIDDQLVMLRLSETKLITIEKK